MHQVMSNLRLPRLVNRIKACSCQLDPSALTPRPRYQVFSTTAAQQEEVQSPAPLSAFAQRRAAAELEDRKARSRAAASRRRSKPPLSAVKHGISNTTKAMDRFLESSIKARKPFRPAKARNSQPLGCDKDGQTQARPMLDEDTQEHSGAISQILATSLKATKRVSPHPATYNSTRSDNDQPHKPTRTNREKTTDLTPPEPNRPVEDRLRHFKGQLEKLQLQCAQDGPWEGLSESERAQRIQSVQDSRRQRKANNSAVDETVSAEDAAKKLWEKGVLERPQHIAVLERKIHLTEKELKAKHARELVKVMRTERAKKLRAAQVVPSNPRMAEFTNQVPFSREHAKDDPPHLISESREQASPGPDTPAASRKLTFQERQRAIRRPSSSSVRSEEGPAEPKRPLNSFERTISPWNVKFDPLPRDDVPVATLAHGLNRVLFNPGVHFVRDPRSGVYNFPRTLESVPAISDFQFDKLPQYITSSKDDRLMKLAQQEDKTFVGSTSSTVAMLCQIYFWMSKGKPVDLSMLSAHWQQEESSFSMGQRLPASVILHHRDGRYAIDADKSMDATIDHNILADYGHMMEKLLTTDHDEFMRFIAGSDDPAPSDADSPQAYQYSTTERMVLRSQLDAHDPHLPRVTFDVKTRGSVAIRQDRLNHEESSGYSVDKLQGPWESFEREYYDLIRSAFLKYQFQARIGGMDGCFVAFHSTQRFFGFQYVPIEEMDVALFGSSAAGAQVFRLALKVLEDVLAEAVQCYPGESVRVTFAAGQKDVAQEPLSVFVHPAEVKTESEPAAGEEGCRMTLLELHGANFVDGKPRLEVDLKPQSNERPEAAVAPGLQDEATSILKTWEIGYDIVRSVSPAVAVDDTVTTSAAVQNTSSANLDNKNVDLASGPDPATIPTDTDATSPPSSEAVPRTPSYILQHFHSTRAIQSMFSTLTLPSGISRKDVLAASERVAALDPPLVSLDALEPDDLARRFPIRDGIDYKARPSLTLRTLRQMARMGEQRRRAAQVAEAADAGMDAQGQRREVRYAELETRFKSCQVEAGTQGGMASRSEQ